MNMPANALSSHICGDKQNGADQRELQEFACTMHVASVQGQLEKHSTRQTEHVLLTNSMPYKDG